MKNKNFSIPFKALLGYIIITAIGTITIWFIYSNISQLNESKQMDESNQKIALIGEAATRLFVTEGISRNIIQNRDTTQLVSFRESIDTISIILNSLKTLYKGEGAQNELDSIENLLKLKEDNLVELLQFRAANASNNYYDRVLKRLEKADYVFGSLDYQDMVKDLKPYQQKVLVDFLKYAEEDNADKLTNRTVDQLINTTKQVLLSLEIQEHEYQKSIAEKENKLLINDLKISDRLRKIRTKIEQEEFQKSLQQIESNNRAMSRTYLVMLIFGIACVVTILIFGMMIISDSRKSRLYRTRLEESKLYAEQLLHSREQILATVTHDLRSPLNSILGYADLMRKTGLSSKQESYLKKLRKSSDYTMKLVNDLLDLSRLEAGRISIDQLPFNPKNLLTDVVATTIPQPDEKNLTITLDLSDDLETNFISDPFRIQQILSNLVGNAYKFTNKGGITITGNVVEKRGETYLEISVQDSGIGISENKQEMIFQEFSQAEKTTEKQYGGFGLGLTISKMMLELLGGSIAVESTLGKGTTFLISIPVQIEHGKLSSGKSHKKLKLIHPETKKVLVVDDSNAQLELIKEIMHGIGLPAQTAKNGVEAIHILENENFDAVLTDIQMPILDGFGLLEKMRLHPEIADIPVVALSGMSNTKKEEYQKMGFAHYLLKPYQINDLIEILADILNLEMEAEEIEPKTLVDAENELFDLSDIELFADGDKEALRGILESLIESIEINIEKLKEAHFQKKPSQIAFVAHKMLPMLRQIKARKAVALLSDLESLESLNLSETEIREHVLKTEEEFGILLPALKEQL